MKITASVQIAFGINEETGLFDDLPIRAEIGAESLHIQEVTGDGRRIQVETTFSSDGVLGKQIAPLLKGLFDAE